MSRKQGEKLLLAVPGWVGACRPPPFQSVTARALSRMHVRVSCDPHCLAAVANSSHDEKPLMPRALGCAPGTYLASVSRYCFVAGWVLASSKGTALVTTSTLPLSAVPAPFVSFVSYMFAGSSAYFGK